MDCKLLLCWCLLAFWSCTAQANTKSYGWGRQLETISTGEEVVVRERALVYTNSNSILMAANDSGLNDTLYESSESLHDFQTGELAIKLAGQSTCFLGTVYTNFTETEKILRRKNHTTVSGSDDIMRAMKVESHQLVRANSTTLNRFCESFYKVRNVDISQTVPFAVYPVTQCIVGPIIIIDIHISIEIKLYFRLRLLL